MGIAAGIVVYIITWWTVLFTVLPLGVKTPDNPEVGIASSAPINPRLGYKFLLTSLISACIWVVIYVLIDIKIIDFRDIAAHMRLD